MEPERTLTIIWDEEKREILARLDALEIQLNLLFTHLQIRKFSNPEPKNQ